MSLSMLMNSLRAGGAPGASGFWRNAKASVMLLRLGLGLVFSIVVNERKAVERTRDELDWPKDV